MNRFYLDEDRIIEADMSSDASLQADEIHKAQAKISLKDLGFYFSLYCQQIKKQINKQLNHIVRDFYSRTEIFLDDQVPNQYQEGSKFITLLRQWRPKIQTFQQKYNDFKRNIPPLTDKKKSKFQQPRKIRFIDMLDRLILSYDFQAKPEQSTNALDTPSKMMVEAQVNKMQTLYDQGRYEESIQKAKQIGKSGKFPQLYFILGNSYKAMQSYEQAVHEYTKAINLAALGCYYNNRGNAYLALQEVSKAESDYKKAIDLQPRNEVYLGNYGNICLSLRKFEKSIEVYNQAINIDSSNDVFYNNRAFAQIKLKNLDDAIESYNKALSLNPSNHIYLKNRANLYMENKMVNKAIQDIKKAIQIEHKHEYYFLKGKWQYLSGKVHAAMLSFSKAHELEPSKKSYMQYYEALRMQLGFK